MNRKINKQGNYKCAAFSAAMALLIHSGVMAQMQQKNVDTIQVNVITRYKPTIHDAVKIDSTPASADTIHISRKVKYDLTNTQFPTSYTPPPISALQIKDAPPEGLFHSLLNAGVGNYNTLYAEYFYNSLRSNNTDYGFHLNHLSADYTTNNYGNSAYSFNDIDGYWEKFFLQHTLTFDAAFDNHVVHDYGYNALENPGVGDEETRQRYDLYTGSLNYASAYHDSSKIGHNIDIGYYHFDGVGIYNNPYENNVEANMKFFTYFNQQRIDLRVCADYNSYANNFESPFFYYPAILIGGQTYNTVNVLFNPYFSTYEKHWDAHLGINAYYASNQPNNSTGINLYPDLLARYHIADDIVMIYAGIDGNQTLNTFKSLTDENPFIETSFPLDYTYTKYHVFGGLAGSITRQLTYNASVAQSMIDNMPLFITDSLVPLRNNFTVVYDNIKVSNIHGDLDYKWNNKLSIILAGDYNIYTPTNQLKAWYNPALKLSATGRYTFENKYTFKAEFFVVGSQYAPEMADGIMTAKTLSGYPDLNLGIDYKYNKVFTAFLNLNNIANVAYYTWDNYEMERFNLMIGIRFGF